MASTKILKELDEIKNELFQYEKVKSDLEFFEVIPEANEYDHISLYELSNWCFDYLDNWDDKKSPIKMLCIKYLRRLIDLSETMNDAPESI